MGDYVELELMRLDDISSNRSNAETWASNAVASARAGSSGRSASAAWTTTRNVEEHPKGDLELRER
jgi:hypothetical protein